MRICLQGQVVWGTFLKIDIRLFRMIFCLPANVDVFVDAMGGAFNVGANITALNKVVYNEMNPFVYELVSWMVNTPKEELINAIEKKIEQFGIL